MFTRRDASTTDRSATDDTQRTATPTPAPSVSQPAIAQQPAPVATATPPVAGRNVDESLVAREDTFEGQLRTARGVRVLGTVRGTIESSQYVHIEENAQVEADITAEEVVIAGEYTGSLTCRQRVEIRATGRVSGQIDTAKLLLHEGGYFDGELHMQKAAPTTAPSAPSASSTSKPDSDERPRRTRYVDIAGDTSTTREVGSSDSSS